MEPISITVREGDSFDELYLNIQKPWGTPYDYSGSVLIADIRRYFNEPKLPSQKPAAVDSFGIVELNPKQGELLLKLTSQQTEGLGRTVPLGYTERNRSSSSIGSSIDVTDEIQGPFLWDLREYFSSPGAAIVGITAGPIITGTATKRIRVTTETPHLLSSKDQIIFTDTGVSTYDAGDFTQSNLAVISPTIFDIVPDTSTGSPYFIDGATTGRINVYKEDTLAIGNLTVIPRISSDSA
jgi:hypothetical protein